MCWTSSTNLFPVAFWVFFPGVFWLVEGPLGLFLDFDGFVAAIALTRPLFVDGSEIFNEEDKLLASIYDVSSPQQLEKLQPDDDDLDTVVINFSGEWQVCTFS